MVRRGPALVWLFFALAACDEKAASLADLADTTDLTRPTIGDLTTATVAADLRGVAPDLGLPEDLAITPPDDLGVEANPDLPPAPPHDLTAVPDLREPLDLLDTSDMVPPPPLPHDVLFDPRVMPTFYITIPANSWDTIEQCLLPPGRDPAPACDYQPATLVLNYDPDPDDGIATTISTAPLAIGLKRKGRATWQALGPPDPTFTGFVADRTGKPSLKLKLENKLLGLNRFTLNNGIQDPSGIRERLGYRVMRALGEDAPLANSALVYVKGPDDTDFVAWGLYVNLQTIDKQFVKEHFGEVGGEIGNLYDTYNDVYFTDLDRCVSRGQAGNASGAQEERFELETNEDDGDLGDLTAAIDAVDGHGCSEPSVGAATFFAEADAVLDLGSFHRNAAIDALLVNWDGFSGARNNYKLYRELARNRTVILPSGIDQSFGWYQGTYYPNWRYSFAHTSSRRTPSLFIQRCKADVEVCWPRYVGQVEIAVGRFATLPLITEATTMADQIRPHVDWSSVEFERSVAFVIHHVSHRAACVQQQLIGEPCEPQACPSDFQCDAQFSP